MKKKIVVLTGAGISAESGLSTFRDSGGLWEGHNVMDVASPEGWRKNKKLVLDFYNQRRRQLLKALPNEAHTSLAKLEAKFDVKVITQNVDDLHERGGSTKIIHLHGELTKARSSIDENLIYDCKGDIKIGDKCDKGSQLRPNIVWFGEMVPAMDGAIESVMEADMLIVIGTSMVVYPAAGLIEFTSADVPKYVIDPRKPESYIMDSDLTFIQKKATIGTAELVNKLLTGF
ncbi:MAG: NAD-dependent deacylase [bacterium]|nr:NAD-dependent deacylase [bacterium]